MPDKMTEGPPRQQDRADEVARAPRAEPRNFDSERPRDDGNYDALGEWMDYPAINTHGSER